MATLLDLQARWEARRADAKRLRQLVDYDAVIAVVLEELHELARTNDAATLSLTEAAKETGYHSGSLGRMLKRGEVKNYGTAARPRVKVSELPRKRASATGTPAVESHGSDDVIALDALASRMDRPRSA